MHSNISQQLLIQKCSLPAPPTNFLTPQNVAGYTHLLWVSVGSNQEVKGRYQSILAALLWINATRPGRGRRRQQRRAETEWDVNDVNSAQWRQQWTRYDVTCQQCHTHVRVARHSHGSFLPQLVAAIYLHLLWKSYTRYIYTVSQKCVNFETV